MNDGYWFAAFLAMIAAILTVPGVMIALRRSTWIGIVANVAIYIFAGVTFFFVPLLLVKFQYGVWETKENPLNAKIYDIMIIMLVGIFWITFQFIGIVTATMMRIRRHRNNQD